jgi:hypothetical protein
MKVSKIVFVVMRRVLFSMGPKHVVWEVHNKSSTKNTWLCTEVIPVFKCC